MSTLKGKRKAVEETQDLESDTEETFPNIHFGSDEESAFDSDDEEAALQRERLEEEQLERELAEEEEEEEEDDDVDDAASNLSDFIFQNSNKPAEDDPDTPGTSPDDPSSIDFAKRRRIVKSKITGEEMSQWDEIDPDDPEDSEPEIENRVGDIPSHFYDDMPHVGYDINGKKIMKPLKGDELDKFLATVDGSAWTSVEDKTSKQNVELTDAELDLIQRLAKSENPDANYDPYEPTIEWYSSKTLDTPLSGKPEPKRRFIPSKWEHKKVMKIVHAIRSGRIVPNKPQEERPKYYNIWSDADEARPDHPMHMPAPKLAPPTHAESYNPPEEYLFTEEEKKQWLDTEPAHRPTDFIPAKYTSLRLVPAFKDFVQQRFERCLDLYLAPRMRRRQRQLTEQDMEEMKPKLPSPNELKPFPMVSTVTYPHPNSVRTRCCAVDPTGMWVVTGAEDGSCRLWELETGRCTRTWQIGKPKGDPIMAVAFCPSKDKAFFIAAAEEKLVVVALLDIVGQHVQDKTTAALNEGFNASSAGITSVTKWSKASESLRENGIWLQLQIKGSPKRIAFHRKGDYFVTVAPDAAGESVLIHQISKHQTQAPFKRLKYTVESAVFHPSKPHLFVATQHEVRIYDLAGQTLVKTLHPGVKMISSLDVHPQGDNVIVGSYDKRLLWHDLDLSDRPYKTLKYHTKAVRSVAFSPSHPLFMSASDDATIHVFHASVYSDLVTEPLIVPLRVLKGHEIRQSLGVLEAKWHPKEPWIVSVGADGVGRLWCN